MSPADEKKPPAAKAQAAAKTEAPVPAAPPPPDPEAEARARIEALQTQVGALETEIRVLEGQIKNRDPAALGRMTRENEALKKRIPRLEKALLALLSEASHAQQPADRAIETDALRQAAIEYFKQSNLPPDLWKNIES